MTFGEEDYWKNLLKKSEIAIRNNYDLFAEIAERPSTKYHPKLSIKGNQWIASYSNVEEGTTLVGAGDSPQEAIDDFNKEFKSKLIPRKLPPIPRRPPRIPTNISIYADSSILDIDTAEKATASHLKEAEEFKLNSSSTVTRNVATECIIINQDGNQFCALVGPNIQEGFAGFGDTPLHAILDLISNQVEDSAWKEILNQKPDPEHWTYPKV